MDDAAATALQTRLADLCGHLNVLHAQLVDSIVEAIEGELWAQWGLRSPEHWLSWQTGLSPAHAKQLVDTARRKAELPTTFAALADGELSIDQVATIAKHVPSLTAQQARAIIKTWVKEGMLGRDNYYDPQDRKERSGLVVLKRPGRAS